MKLQRFGFLLAFAAILAFAFHVEQAEANHFDDPSRHCCLCHTTVSGTASLVSLTPHVVDVSSISQTAKETLHEQPPHRVNAPRAPPSCL